MLVRIASGPLGTEGCGPSFLTSHELKALEWAPSRYIMSSGEEFDTPRLPIWSSFETWAQISQSMSPTLRVKRK